MGIHCFGLIVTGHNVDLFALRIVTLVLRIVVCNTLLPACVLCGDVYPPWGLSLRVIILYFAVEKSDVNGL